MNDDMSVIVSPGPIAGQVGDGNFHCLMVVDHTDPEELQRVHLFSERLARWRVSEHFLSSHWSSTWQFTFNPIYHLNLWFIMIINLKTSAHSNMVWIRRISCHLLQIFADIEVLSFLNESSISISNILYSAIMWHMSPLGEPWPWRARVRGNTEWVWGRGRCCVRRWDLRPSRLCRVSKKLLTQRTWWILGKFCSQEKFKYFKMIKKKSQNRK